MRMKIKMQGGGEFNKSKKRGKVEKSGDSGGEEDMTHDKGGVEGNKRSWKKKKKTKGGASEDVHTTKVQVSLISSRHTVLQSMLSEYIGSNIKNFNCKRPELFREKHLKKHDRELL